MNFGGFVDQADRKVTLNAMFFYQGYDDHSFGCR